VVVVDEVETLRLAPAALVLLDRLLLVAVSVALTEVPLASPRVAPVLPVEVSVAISEVLEVSLPVSRLERLELPVVAVLAEELLVWLLEDIEVLLLLL
jgi:hypothetical protein